MVKIVVFYVASREQFGLYIALKQNPLLENRPMVHDGKIVILARGLGTRMRRQGASDLSTQQSKIADSGVKALVPIDRPFLDYVLSAAADAGWTNACLVIGPEHQAIRDYYGSLSYERIKVSFAVQERPLGTANAVSAVEEFADGDDFLCMNSDNYYPTSALEDLANIEGLGLAAFESKAMVEGSNIPADRISKFAVVQVNEDDTLAEIIEKPSNEQLASIPKPHFLSMNCWRFGPAIFPACRAIKPSARGELEIPDAVAHVMHQQHQPFKVIKSRSAVLDLSCRDDINAVALRLKGTPVVL